ncbi:transposase [Bacillus cereus]|uniref:transposase n=1 Tax=Bacillus cereus TaxID=1396 RepID=UPI003BFA66CC
MIAKIISCSRCIFNYFLGMWNDTAILSDGHKIENNTFTFKMEKKLKCEQRKLSKRALIAKNKRIHLLDAKNYQKQKLKVARLHESVINQRDDFLSK